VIKIESLRFMDSYLLKFEKILPEKKVFRYFQLGSTLGSELEALLSDVIPFIQ
jgi:hypothetical protein